MLHKIHPGTNHTLGLSVGDDIDDGILDREMAKIVIFMFMAVIVPIISILGLTGNIISICVLVTQGVDKSYNVLLIALACFDSSYLLSLTCYGFWAAAKFNHPTSRHSFEFIFFQIIGVFDTGGAICSLSTPILITTERLIAVFFPLSSSKILSRNKTFCAVFILFSVMYGALIFYNIMNSINFENKYVNATANPGIIELSVYINTADVSEFVLGVSKIVTGPFPITYVTAGCVLLAIKLKLTAMKRDKMTNAAAQRSTAQVTITLLVVCCVYTFLSVILFLFHTEVIASVYVPKDTNGLFAVVLGQVSNLTVELNSSLNFIIYIAMNPSFRKTFLELFGKYLKK